MQKRKDEQVCTIIVVNTSLIKSFCSVYRNERYFYIVYLHSAEDTVQKRRFTASRRAQETVDLSARKRQVQAEQNLKQRIKRI
jgi:hypothetical protein